MPEEPTGSEDDTSDNRPEGDLPSSSGESFADLDSLKKELAGGASSTDASEPDSERGGQGQSPDPDSGKSDGSESGSDTVRMTFHVDKETAERLRNAVYWTATPVTLSGTARDALRAAVEMLEQEHNNGEPFPDRDAELKGGNPNLKG